MKGASHVIIKAVEKINVIDFRGHFNKGLIIKILGNKVAFHHFFNFNGFHLIGLFFLGLYW